MKPDTCLIVGDVVQLDPDITGNPMFRACFMIVTEPKSFGAQGFVQSLGDNGEQGGRAYYRAKWAEMELIGRAEWMPSDDADDAFREGR